MTYVLNMDILEKWLKRLYETPSWRTLRPTTQQKYSFWVVRYAHFLREHTDTVTGFTPEQKAVAFLKDEYMESSSSTKRQALSAIRFFYRTVMNEQFTSTHIKKEYVLPETMPKQDILWELAKLPVNYHFMGWLFFGSGLSLSEAMSLRHENIKTGMVIVSGRQIPLCNKSIPLYRNIKKRRGLVFPSKRKQGEPMTNTMFGHMCRKYGIDRRITPSMLRANFILIAIQMNGVEWTREMTGLSRERMKQYLSMMPRCNVV